MYIRQNLGMKQAGQTTGLGRSADNKDSLVVQSIRQSEGRANQTARGRTAASVNVTHVVGGDGQPSMGVG